MASVKVPKPLGAAVLFCVVLFAIAACGGDRETNAPVGAEPIDTEQLSATVDNSLFPLALVRASVYEGTEGDAEVRVESRVLDQVEHVAGVSVTVVDVNEFEDGELVEHTLDYYAQQPDGSVVYMGERVDDYDGGKLIGHSGQWLAGRNGASPGLFMPARLERGAIFEQERAPGVAEDRSTVVDVGVDVKTPAGSFSDCIKTEDFAPLDKTTGFKYYCPGAGLVREEFSDGAIDLIRLEKRR